MSDLYLPRLRPDQWAIATHPAKTKAISMGRRWGKSVMAGAIALAAANDGGKVAWVVPTYKNARPVWRWVEGAVGPLLKEGAVSSNKTDRVVEFPHTGGFLGVYSADNDVGLRGEAFHLVVVDEAARVAEETWTEVIMPTLADYAGDAILISTPKGRNWFWQEWQRGYAQMDAEQAAFTAPSSANPMPTIRRAYELARDRVPDNVFRQEWDAEFVSTAFDIWLAEMFDGHRYDPDVAIAPLQIVGRYNFYDSAVSEKDTAAYSACMTVELLVDYSLRIVDVWRDRVAFPSLVERSRERRRRWNFDGKLLGEIIESKSSGTSLYQTLTASLPEDEAATIVPFVPTVSKEQRASQASVWGTHHVIHLPKPGLTVPWLHALEAELYAFPSGPYADQVDCLSMAALYLEHYLSAGVRGRQATVQGPTSAGQRREV